MSHTHPSRFRRLPVDIDVCITAAELNRSAAGSSRQPWRSYRRPITPDPGYTDQSAALRSWLNAAAGAASRCSRRGVACEPDRPARPGIWGISCGGFEHEVDDTVQSRIGQPTGSTGLHLRRRHRAPDAVQLASTGTKGRRGNLIDIPATGTGQECQVLIECCYLSYPKGAGFHRRQSPCREGRKTSIINGGGVGVQVNSSDVTIAQCIIGGSAGRHRHHGQRVGREQRGLREPARHHRQLRGAGFIRGNGIDRNREHGVNIAASTVVRKRPAPIVRKCPRIALASGITEVAVVGNVFQDDGIPAASATAQYRHLPRWWRIGRCEGFCPRQRRQLERVPHREVFEHAHGRPDGSGHRHGHPYPGAVLGPLGRQERAAHRRPAHLIVHTMVGGHRAAPTLCSGARATPAPSPTGLWRPERRVRAGRRAVAVADPRPAGRRAERRQRLCHLGGDLRRRRPVPALVGPPAHRAGGPGRLVVPAGGRAGAWWTPPAVAGIGYHAQFREWAPDGRSCPARSASSSCARSSSRAWPPRCPAPPPRPP